MSPEVPILDIPARLWECPNCNATDVTREAKPHTRYHTCVGLKGLTAPMVPAGKKATTQVRALVREDYVGKEDVQYGDDGVPVMAIETVHDDGSNDIAVLASSVNATGRVAR